MTSGLFGGRAFPIPWAHHDEVRHRRLLAEGINFTAAAAFTPETKLSSIDANLVLTGSYVNAGLDVTVTPFVPAQAHILVFLYFQNTGGTPLVAEANLLENGVVIGTAGLPSLAGTQQHHVPVQRLRTLLPNTVYTYSIEARAAGASGGDLVAHSSMSVRVEHRTLVP